MPQPPTKYNHAGNPIEEVTILKVRPGKLHVKTTDDKIGVILEREWGGDRRLSAAIPVFTKGQTLEAVLIQDKSRAGQYYFSICELTNPWASAREKYIKGQIVTGEIVNLRRFGAFVQIEPGITAIIWNKDLPLFAAEIPADQLVIGDKLRGVITHIDFAKKKMELSVNAYLEEIAREDLDVRAEIVHDLFLQELEINTTGWIEKVEADNSKNKRIHQQLNKLSHVLILDDDVTTHAPITQALQQNFNVQIQHASTSSEAKTLMQQQQYDLFIIDIHLENNDNGIAFSRNLLSRNLHNIIIRSAHPGGAQMVQELEEEFDRYIPFIFKQEDRNNELLMEKIDEYLQGRIAMNTLYARPKFKMENAKSISKEQALQEILQSLVEQENISQAFVLELVPGLRTVRLLSMYPDQGQSNSIIDFDALYYSPVRKVVEEGEEVYFKDVSLHDVLNEGIFKNLFPQYSFRSCLGLPVQLTGRPLRHVLFVLDDNRDYMDAKLREKIAQYTHQIGTIIEKSEFLQLIYQFNEGNYKGHLLGSLVHELNNKIPALKDILTEGITRLKTHDSQTGFNHLQTLHTALEDLNQLFEAYSKLAYNRLDLIDVNEIIAKAAQQLKPLAKEVVVRIYTSYGKKLPRVEANAIHVEQIIINLLLNAIQHIDIQLERFRALTENYKPQLSELFNGYVQISTVYVPQRKICQIRILDSGPGVAYDQKQRIFEWGTTTRKGGQGVGLYVSKSLAEAMQGKLVLVDSIRYIGCLFLLELPCDH